MGKVNYYTVTNILPHHASLQFLMCNARQGFWDVAQMLDLRLFHGFLVDRIQILISMPET